MATASATVVPNFVLPAGSPRLKQQGIGAGLLGLGSSMHAIEAGRGPRTLQYALQADVLPLAAGL